MKSIFYNFREGLDFDLPSRRRLIKRLGEYDSLAEYVVCAEREFVNRFKIDMGEKGDFAEYVTNKAKEHSVNLKRGVFLDNFHAELYKSFMVNSYALFLEFICLYVQDIQLLVNKDFALETDHHISKLEHLKAALKKEKINTSIPAWLFDVLDYYRIVRNSIAHNRQDKSACQRAYKKIDLSAIELDYPVFKGLAPNPVEMISMDDFYMFSACIKHVANLLTKALMTEIKWENLGKNGRTYFEKNITKGVDCRKFVNQLIAAQYCHKVDQKVVDSIIEDIRPFIHK